MLIENNDISYKSNSHYVFKCIYHVIFCPKYRRKIFDDKLSKELKILFNNTCAKYNSSILELEIMPEHVHMILDCDPSFGVSKLIRRIKGDSSRIMRQKFPELKSKLPSLWTRSAFVSTVGSVSLETVKKYIENQKGK